jgi:hypothetical protein
MDDLDEVGKLTCHDMASAKLRCAITDRKVKLGPSGGAISWLDEIAQRRAFLSVYKKFCELLKRSRNLAV